MSNEVIIAILSSGALSSIISFILQAYKDRRRSNKIDKFLLLHLIEETCKDALQDEQVSKEDLQKLDEMLSLYKGIGGNGYADTLITQVRKLPIIL